jgi:hypothetical protein
MTYVWTLEEGGVVKAQGAAQADADGLITIPTLPFSKTTRRLIVVRDEGALLFADTHVLFAREVGLVNFNLDASLVNAQRKYILLGSISGTSPGFPLPGGLATLPLNWDVFTNLIVLLLNSPIFVNFTGTLDSAGQATAQMNTLSQLPEASAGVVIHFAYALKNPWDVVSNPAGIEILP